MGEKFKPQNDVQLQYENIYRKRQASEQLDFIVRTIGTADPSGHAV
jgi:hypothetical protein